MVHGMFLPRPTGSLADISKNPIYCRLWLKTWGWSGVRKVGGHWDTAVGPSGWVREWDIRDMQLRSSFSSSIFRSIHRECFWTHGSNSPGWPPIGRERPGFGCGSPLPSDITMVHRVTRDVNILWDMLVGQVGNGSLGPLALSGKCVITI